MLLTAVSLFNVLLSLCDRTLCGRLCRSRLSLRLFLRLCRGGNGGSLFNRCGSRLFFGRCRRRCVYYLIRLNVDCTFYGFNYRIIVSVEALEGYKEAVLDNILCRIRIGFNIGRSTADNFGNFLYLCQQKESTEVFHLTAVLEEYTDGHASLNVAS